MLLTVCIIISLMVGGCLGAAFMAFCQTAGREDRKLEKLYNKTDTD